MSATAQNKVREYRSSNFEAMTNDEIFSHIQDQIGFNNITIKAAKKLYDDIKDDIQYKSRKVLIAGCVRVKSIDKGQPVRIKKISEELGVETKEVAKVCKFIKKDRNIKKFPETSEYAEFLLERLDINSISKKKIIKETIELAQEEQSLVGKPATSIGIAAVAIETDIDKKEIAEEVATSTATIRSNKEEVKKAIGDK